MNRDPKDLPRCERNPTYANYTFYTRNRRGEVTSPVGLGAPTLTTHLSPRWDFRIFMFPMFYTPAAPLGLHTVVFWFSGLLVFCLSVPLR